MTEREWIALVMLTATSLSLAYWAWLAIYRIVYIESFFQSSIMVKDNRKVMSQAGLPGKLFRISMIANVMVFPRGFLRKGLIDASDLESVPGWLKRRLTIVWLLLLGLSIIAGILTVVLKLSQ